MKITRLHGWFGHKKNMRAGAVSPYPPRFSPKAWRQGKNLTNYIGIYQKINSSKTHSDIS